MLSRYNVDYKRAVRLSQTIGNNPNNKVDGRRTSTVQNQTKSVSTASSPLGHEERQGFGMRIDCGLLLSLDGGEKNGENMARLMARLRRAYGEKIHTRTCRLA
jgi:hypothetical protein